MENGQGIIWKVIIEFNQDGGHYHPIKLTKAIEKEIGFPTVCSASGPTPLPSAQLWLIPGITCDEHKGSCIQRLVVSPSRYPSWSQVPAQILIKMTAAPFYHINTSAATGRNVSLNDGDEYEYEDKYAELRQSLNIMSLIVYCLAFVLGVLGNGVVIWVTGFKMKKTVNTVWFLNLAVADFLFTVFLPLSITLTALDFHWPFGKFMCKLNTTISFLNLYASVYILVVISVDRCVSVVWPVWAQNHRNVRKASFVSLGVWVMALILSTPYFIFRDTALYNKDENDIECFNNFALSDDYENESVIQLRLFRHKAMTITNFLLGFVVPFTVIVSCYAVIIHHIKRNRTLASHSRRSFKIIAAVITAFFLCWAPYHIIDLLGLANSLLSDRSETLDHVTTIGIPITSSLAFLNSCLNPLLYVFMGQDFKDIVRKSILNVLETAFQEEVSGRNTGTKSVDTSQSREMLPRNSEV
uniref:chemokine-like receptor 1 n=1 Tax=Gasterosteus aculeatus aculeatus TaxID=481459 RepID=UPI001A99566A|nr:chemokine-like receptor 1 [Gasterosteus aculeatus aculeatus]